MKKPVHGLVLVALGLAACTSATGTPTLPPANTPAPTPAVTTHPTATEAPPSETPPPTARNTEAPPATEPDVEPTPTLLNTQAPGLLPDPAAYSFEPVAGGFVQPLLVTHASDGSGRIFVVEQTGRIRIVQDGQIVTTPFLDRRNRVSGNYEQGLLGLAFHPDYAQNGIFFISYTDLEGDTMIERCQVSEQDPNVGADESCTTVLSVDQPYPNHNGGGIGFGPDGYLYVGLGDGGSGGDPEGRAQNINTLLGKMLRLEVNGDEAPYNVPPDNPFVGRDDASWEIWAYGLRNPWRWSFDRATGDLYIADVGQNSYEEVNFQPAASGGGENYGWDYFEGLHTFEGQPSAGEVLVEPIAEYAQASTGGCSVTGGFVYRGSSLPELNGVYFFGDACTGQVWVIISSEAGRQMLTWSDTPYGISSFGEDEAGELYLTDLFGGGVYRLARN
jgi:glucose/arabinose dehydrogenase